MSRGCLQRLLDGLPERLALALQPLVPPGAAGLSRVTAERGAACAPRHAGWRTAAVHPARLQHSSGGGGGTLPCSAPHNSGTSGTVTGAGRSSGGGGAPAAGATGSGVGHAGHFALGHARGSHGGAWAACGCGVRGPGAVHALGLLPHLAAGAAVEAAAVRAWSSEPGKPPAAARRPKLPGARGAPGRVAVRRHAAPAAAAAAAKGASASAGRPTGAAASSAPPSAQLPAEAVSRLEALQREYGALCDHLPPTPPPSLLHLLPAIDGRFPRHRSPADFALNEACKLLLRAAAAPPEWRQKLDLLTTAALVEVAWYTAAASPADALQLPAQRLTPMAVLAALQLDPAIAVPSPSTHGAPLDLRASVLDPLRHCITAAQVAAAAQEAAGGPAQDAARGSAALGERALPSQPAASAEPAAASAAAARKAADEVLRAAGVPRVPTAALASLLPAVDSRFPPARSGEDWARWEAARVLLRVESMPAAERGELSVLSLLGRYFKNAWYAQDLHPAFTRRGAPPNTLLSRLCNPIALAPLLSADPAFRLPDRGSRSADEARSEAVGLDLGLLRAGERSPPQAPRAAVGAPVQPPPLGLLLEAIDKRYPPAKRPLHFLKNEAARWLLALQPGQVPSPSLEALRAHLEARWQQQQLHPSDGGSPLPPPGTHLFVDDPLFFYLPTPVPDLDLGLLDPARLQGVTLWAAARERAEGSTAAVLDAEGADGADADAAVGEGAALTALDADDAADLADPTAKAAAADAARTLPDEGAAAVRDSASSSARPRRTPGSVPVSLEYLLPAIDAHFSPARIPSDDARLAATNAARLLLQMAGCPSRFGPNSAAAQNGRLGAAMAPIHRAIQQLGGDPLFILPPPVSHPLLRLRVLDKSYAGLLPPPPEALLLWRATRGARARKAAPPDGAPSVAAQGPVQGEGGGGYAAPLAAAAGEGAAGQVAAQVEGVGGSRADEDAAAAAAADAAAAEAVATEFRWGPMTEAEVAVLKMTGRWVEPKAPRPPPPPPPPSPPPPPAEPAQQPPSGTDGASAESAGADAPEQAASPLPARPGLRAQAGSDAGAAAGGPDADAAAADGTGGAAAAAVGIGASGLSVRLSELVQQHMGDRPATTSVIAVTDEQPAELVPWSGEDTEVLLLGMRVADYKQLHLSDAAPPPQADANACAPAAAPESATPGSGGPRSELIALLRRAAAPRPGEAVGPANVSCSSSTRLEAEGEPVARVPGGGGGGGEAARARAPAGGAPPGVALAAPLVPRVQGVPATPVVVVTSAAEAERVLQHAAGVDSVGVDAEWTPGGLCLVQLALPATDSAPLTVYLLDLVAAGEAGRGPVMAAVAGVLSQPRWMKVAHAAAQDRARLLREYGIPLGPLVDLQHVYSAVRAARVRLPVVPRALAGRGARLAAVLRRVGLQHSLKEEFKERHAREPDLWARRPLTAEMVSYAQQDVAPLLDAYRAMLRYVLEREPPFLFGPASRAQQGTGVMSG